MTQNELVEMVKKMGPDKILNLLQKQGLLDDDDIEVVVTASFKGVSNIGNPIVRVMFDPYQDGERYTWSKYVIKDVGGQLKAVPLKN